MMSRKHNDGMDKQFNHVSLDAWKLGTASWWRALVLSNHSLHGMALHEDWCGSTI